MNHAEQILINEKQNLETQIENPFNVTYTPSAMEILQKKLTDVIWAINSINDDKVN